jgi:hypothetical protein
MHLRTRKRPQRAVAANEEETMKGHIYTQTLAVIVLALALATVALPSAGANTSQALPSALAHIQEPGSVSDFDTYSFQEPTGVYDVGLREPTGAAAAAGGGFGWSDAAVGGGFVLGLCLLAAGVRQIVCSRSLVTQPHS